MTGIARMHAIVLDAPDTRRLAEFYRDLIGWEIVYADPPEEGGWTTLSDGGGVRISFQYAPDHRPPAWPDPERPQQMHIDVHVADLDEAERRVLELGATKTEVQPSTEGTFRVYLDPAGHPFCLCQD
ncbi:MAG TPA: VOC family protein [Actinophytocola sp.]|uniref:VOC family protein n=1 Tax=Actinophytocola sp. TaxID=1872138 RepID=UPI002DBB1AEF|nr:VOC family protein [Actinophytocola sp.]HEU5473035.1 VOC family protein [Actinophytocola sp.]